MKTILLAGGAGYVGAHAAKFFSNNGYKVITLDNLIYGHEEFVKWGEFFQGDIGDAELLKLIFSKYRIDVVSHFAAFTYVGESVTNPEKYYENNVNKALVLLGEAAKHNIKIFQFSSTCAVYGVPDFLPLTEEHKKNPINPYGKTKMFFEEAIKDFASAYDFSYSILRYFNAAGADPDAEIGEDHNPETHLIPLILDAALGKRKNIHVFGIDYNTPDGSCLRDYIHVNDLAKAHLLAIEKGLNSQYNTIYNIGNGNGFSVLEVIEKVKKITGKNFEVLLGDRRPGDPESLIGSSEKIFKELGWKAQFGLDEIIKTAWKWHKKRFG